VQVSTWLAGGSVKGLTVERLEAGWLTEYGQLLLRDLLHSALNVDDG